MFARVKSADLLIGVVALVAILVALLPSELQALLVYQREDFRWYQLLTSNIVHESTSHLLLNLIALVLIGIVARRLMSGLQFSLIFVVGLVSAVFAEHALGQPPFMSITITETRGLSGALHGLFAGSMLFLAVVSDRIALVVLFALVVKVSAEALLGKPFVSSGTVELVAVMGHFGGTIAGLTVATVFVRGRGPSAR